MEPNNSKRSKKGRKSRPVQAPIEQELQQEPTQEQQQQQHHHPWDEVSLPGAAPGSGAEQPTILLINGIADDSQLQDRQSKAAALKLALESNPQSEGISSLGNHPVLSVPTTPGGSHLLDFESHLIENVVGQGSGVGIRELTPFEQELQQGTSKVGTDDEASVIEVEPAGAKTKQAIKTLAPPHQIAEVDETANTPSEAVRRTAEQLVEEIDEALQTLVPPQQIPKSEETSQPSELVRRTAEQLVDEIERELIETLSKDVDEAKTEHDNEVKRDRDELSSLSQQVEVQLNELTSILKNKPQAEIVLELPEPEEEEPRPLRHAAANELKLVEVPTPKTEAEEQQRKEFIDSLPQIEQHGAGETETDAQRLSADCKREYYQSLKKYLLQSSQDKPPIPLQTYRWEDLRRARERGGYPWTHLYKRPLGPDEQPEIVLLLRKSQELRFKSESPKSLKKVRYDEQVLVKETERYIQDLSEDEALAHTSEDSSEESDSETESERGTHNEDTLSECISCVSDSVLAVGGHNKPRKTSRLAHIRDIIRRRRSGRTHEDAQSLPGTSANPSRQNSVHELAPPPGSLVPNTQKPPKSTPAKPKQSFDIMKKLKSLAERQKKRLNIKRITLKKDEKIVLGEQQKIMKLKASPKSDRGEIPHFIEKQDSDDILELVEYDESPCRKRNKEELEQEQREDLPSTSGVAASVPQPEEIIELPVAKTETDAPALEITEPQEEKVEEGTAEADGTESPPKKTPRLRREHVYEEIGHQKPELVDQPIIELDALKKSLTRQDHMAIDDIEAAKAVPLDRMGSSEEEQVAGAGKSGALLAPISSIDSTSSDEERARLAQLSPVAEESDAEPVEAADLRPALKKEASPAPSDKKVTFSHVEDEAEPHREDIELPQEVLEAASNAARWKNESDHEYEPVGVSPAHEASPEPALVPAHAHTHTELQVPMDIDGQLDSSAGTTPRTESRTDYEIHTSQVDSSALEELPLQPENRKKSFMASAQDRTKKMQDGLRQQAGKLRTKLRSSQQAKPKPISGSPKAKAKERRRFKAPEFSKIKMPEIKRPDMSKFRDIKRPEFTKFHKPDMSKFKLPDKFSTLKLRRSKSFKENESELTSEEPQGTSGDAAAGGAAEAAAQPATKKKFEFNFGTYPRAFRKKKPTEEPPPPPALESSLGTERLSLSVIPSTETQPSQTSTSSPQGDRGPGPVRSRWADKFSDVSYNDSEGSRYRRYGSELESFDRESSLERRMKEDLEGAEDTASEAQQPQTMGILGVVADSKQFAEFDEENRAIHEISSKRTREFKRRPMVHQDSDLRSEDSRDAEGWTEKDIQKNKLLRKAELEAEAGYHKYYDSHSTASSGKKVVMEPIDDDEFFLRKRGISEDNIQLRQYISAAIREGYDMPNALQHVGYSADPVPGEYGDFEAPPAKPRRLHRHYRPDIDDSQEFQRSDYGDDLSMSQNGSEFTPKRPLRKARSRSKQSVDGSQEIHMGDGASSSIQYFDDDEEYLRPPTREQQEAKDEAATEKVPQPLAPRRHKKRTRDDASVEKDADSFFNGFGGRSVSNTFLQPHEDVIVYRTEHEYRHIPLATPDNFTDGASVRTPRSEDDRTSRGADSLVLDMKIKPGEDNEQGAARSKSDERFVIDMLESDGYAVVRKETLPKPTPPARRKKFTRSPGERFATLPSIRGSRGSPPPARPPPPQQYIPTEDSPLVPLVPRRRSAASLDEIPQMLIKSNYESQLQRQQQQPQKQQEEEDDYEEPGALERPESPRSNLQSGEVINKMKFRPLPAPPRPPREKRSTRAGSNALDSYEDSEQVASSSQADSYDQQGEFEVEVSTQTDPLPDDFVCEEFEITEDMKIIEPRRGNGSAAKTLEDLLRSVETQETHDEVDGVRVLTEDEQLAKGLQRFRDANQRSMSERSRASSQADRSKSLSRPQTPSSAVVIERRVPTPSLVAGEEQDATVLASLIVRPISAADLADDELRREEEELRREGLLSDSSVQSKSDVEEEEHGEVALSDYAASSADLDAAVEQLQQAQLESDYESRLEDDEVERTLRDSEYEEEEEEDAGEKYSDQYDEEVEEDEETRLERELTEQELDEALEKELQEAMEKELSDYRQKEDTLSEDEEEHAPSEIEYRHSEDEEKLQSGSDTREVVEKPIRKVTASEPTEAEVTPKFVATLPTEPAYGHDELDEEDVPLPPPRRKSTTTLEPAAAATTLTIAEQAARELTPVQSLQSPPEPQLPTRLAELEVERLRVHALQAGQIQVSQLHGSHIKADDLECKSGQLVVQNIELPPGFIDDIVERVREQRPSLLTTETQTSRQASSEPATSDVEQPVKPPRHSKATEQSPPNLDEQTQTEVGLMPLPPPPAAYPSVEYLQSLAPLAFYNLQRSAEAEQAEAAGSTERKAPHKCRRRHVQEQAEPESGSDLEEQLVERPRSRSSRRSRTRSATQPLEEYDEDQPRTVVQAGRQFIAACSLELVNIINQLTHYVRGEAMEPQQAQQSRHISALMVLFILITFGVLVFLLTGRQVHTHHWDYFNPPGNEGRQT